MAVINPIPREKAAGEVQPIYDQLGQTFGRMPNIFGVMAHRPSALKNFLPFYAAVMADGSIEPKVKELAYLKTARINGCAYWTRAHTASAKRAGVTEDQIKELDFCRRSDKFNPKEKATLLYAERMTRGAAAIREGTLEELKEHYSEDQLVELTLVVAVANLTNRFNDALQVEPDLG